MAPDSGAPSSPGGATSIHLRRAIEGDLGSLDWVVVRLTPLLVAHASYRLGPELRRLYDPEDLVHDAWVVAFPKLAELATRSGRHTPVLLRFLTTTLLYRTNELARRHLRRSGPNEFPGDGSEGAECVSSQTPAAATGVVSRAIRDECRALVLEHIAALSESDREILILRGIEQQPNRVVATLLELEPSAVTMRYRRALERLRERLPGSVFDELAEE